MKVAVISDTHWGVRNDNVALADHMSKFYAEVFFPYVDEHEIKTILHLGDIVDRRKYINFVTARRLREDFIRPIHERGIDAHFIVGNHDVTYKNTNDVNSMRELYDNTGFKFNYYDTPTELNLDGTHVLMMPWINSSNFEECMKAMKETKAQVLFGHLEINGFEMYRGMPSHEGFDSSVFESFDRVYSGHFHHRSSRGNITYLGAPYEMTWSDYDDPRGFHVFDTETREVEFIQNPNHMFTKVVYDDSKWDEDLVMELDFSFLTGQYVKVIVQKKVNQFFFDTFLSKVETASPVSYQIVEHNFSLESESEDDIIGESEDTLTTLRKYVDGLEVDHDKKLIDGLLREIYEEAISLESA